MIGHQSGICSLSSATKMEPKIAIQLFRLSPFFAATCKNYLEPDRRSKQTGPTDRCSFIGPLVVYASVGHPDETIAEIVLALKC